jgi:hypothetical protein
VTNIEIIKLLIEKGNINIDQRTEGGVSPVRIAGHPGE